MLLNVLSFGFGRLELSFTEDVIKSREGKKAGNWHSPHVAPSYIWPFDPG